MQRSRAKKWTVYSYTLPVRSDRKTIDHPFYRFHGKSRDWTFSETLTVYHEKMRLISVLLVLVLVVAVAALGLSYKRWEGQPPAIQLDHDFKALGRTPSLKFTVTDSGTGLKDVVIRLKHQDQDVVLASDAFPKN